MFILTCKSATRNIYQTSTVDSEAKAMANRYNESVTIDQFEAYLGDLTPKHHVFLNPVAPSQS